VYEKYCLFEGHVERYMYDKVSRLFGIQFFDYLT